MKEGKWRSRNGFSMVIGVPEKSRAGGHTVIPKSPVSGRSFELRASNSHFSFYKSEH